MYVTSLKKKKSKRKNQNPYQTIIYPQNGHRNTKSTSRKKQTAKFLNCYNFAYAGRDVVNQAGKVASKIISQATGETNKIAKDRIDQVIRSGGAEIERVAPKIIKGAIKEVYKTPFRMLGNLGKSQFNKIKRKLFK